MRVHLAVTLLGREGTIGANRLGDLGGEPARCGASIDKGAAADGSIAGCGDGGLGTLGLEERHSVGVGEYEGVATECNGNNRKCGTGAKQRDLIAARCIPDRDAAIVTWRRRAPHRE